MSDPRPYRVLAVAAVLGFSAFAGYEFLPKLNKEQTNCIPARSGHIEDALRQSYMTGVDICEVKIPDH